MTTAEEILSLPAGAALDAEVWQQIFGCVPPAVDEDANDYKQARGAGPWRHRLTGKTITLAQYCERLWTIPSSVNLPIRYSRAHPPHFSTDVAAVWRVVDALSARGCRLSLNDCRGLSAPMDGWAALFDLPDGHDTGDLLADLAATAICRAALLAKLMMEGKT